MCAEKLQSKRRFLLLYASQTGQAKAISEEIAAKSSDHGLKADLFCMSLIDKRFSIEKETCVVFVVSTTGDGEPPDTAIKFCRRLNRSSLQSDYLRNLNYTLLALGDSNYLKFAAFGRQLELRLKALSAVSFYPTGYGDDAFGIETGVDPWIDNLWPALWKQLGVEINNTSGNLLNGIFSFEGYRMNSSPLSIENTSEQISLENLPSVIKGNDTEKWRVPKLPPPLLSIQYDEVLFKSSTEFIPNEKLLVLPSSAIVKVCLVAARCMTSGDEVKNTLELTFKFEDKILEHEPGDSFGFICHNNETEVNMLLKRLNLEAVADLQASLVLHKDSTSKRSLPSHIPSLFSIKEIFLHCLEIHAVPKKILMRILAEYTENEEEKLSLLFLSSQQGSSYFTDLIRKPCLSVFDILMHYTSCNPPVEKIIEYLPPLKARFYSVASSPLVDKSIFKIVFNVLKMKKCSGRQNEREGVCTGWLNHLCTKMLTLSSSNIIDNLNSLKIDDKPILIPIYKRKNQHFKFPQSLDEPLIMVGPGTGIAPFIGYLQHREVIMKMYPEGSKVGETWLFYGCRYEEKDFLYKTELDRLVQCRVLQNLIVSFSRDAPSSEPTTKYVHENIKLYAKKITDCIKSHGKIMVCGDAKHMAHDVQQAFIEVLQIGSGIDELESRTAIQNLQKEHKYVNDVWA